MKKQWFAVLMTGAVALSAVCASAVLAGEAETASAEESSLAGTVSSFLSESGALDKLTEDGGVLDDLFGSEGVLSEYVPEGIDVKEFASGLAEQLEDEDSALYQKLEDVSDMFVNEDGSFNPDALTEIAGSILSGSIDGFGEEDTAMIGLYMDESFQKAVRDYVKSANEGLIDAGDVQLVSATLAAAVTQDDGSVKTLGYFSQLDYKAEGTDMVLVGGTGDVMLVTLVPDGNGAWEATEGRRSEDGEKYTESVEAMSQEVGMTADEFFEATGATQTHVLGELLEYMEENPDVKRIEYSGELLTYEEIEEKFAEAAQGLLGGTEEAEDMTEA